MHHAGDTLPLGRYGLKSFHRHRCMYRHCASLKNIRWSIHGQWFHLLAMYGPRNGLLAGCRQVVRTRTYTVLARTHIPLKRTNSLFLFLLLSFSFLYRFHWFVTSIHGQNYDPIYFSFNIFLWNTIREEISFT